MKKYNCLPLAPIDADKCIVVLTYYQIPAHVLHFVTPDVTKFNRSVPAKIDPFSKMMLKGLL